MNQAICTLNERFVYTYGGLVGSLDAAEGLEIVLEDMWRLDTVNGRWWPVRYSGYAPGELLLCCRWRFGHTG